MSFYEEIELRCDGDPGDEQFACDDEVFHALTRGQALDMARKRGWKVSRRSGRTIHLCPTHKNRA